MWTSRFGENETGVEPEHTPGRLVLGVVDQVDRVADHFPVSEAELDDAAAQNFVGADVLKAWTGYQTLRHRSWLNPITCFEIEGLENVFSDVQTGTLRSNLRTLLVVELDEEDTFQATRHWLYWKYHTSD